MTEWKTLSSERVFENPWFSVKRDEVLDHNEKPLTYSVIELKTPSVFIMAVDAQGRILLQREYRYTIDKQVWSMPAGHSDGEDLLAAAQRELREETGLESQDWVDMGNTYSMIGIANAPGQIFLARNVYSVTNERDEDEPITGHEFMTLDKVQDMVRSGEINNLPTIAALYLAQLHGIS